MAKLSELLEKLQVIENEVRTLIEAEGGETRSEGVSASATLPSRGSRPLFAGESIVINDLVKIINPNRDQQQKGRIIGRTGKGRLGFLRIITPDGLEVRRIPKNVIVITLAEYNVLPDYK